MVARRDLIVTQGSSWSKAWRFTLQGQPLVDHTWTARAQVRLRKDQPGTVLHEWSSLGSSPTITVDDQGTVTLIVAPATSSAWAWTRGVYDLELTKGTTTYRLVEGSVTVDREVTR